MNRRLLTVLLIAFIVAAACAFLVFRVLGNRLAAARPVPTTSVVAAKTDIKLGSLLTAADLTTIEIAGSIPKGAIQDPKAAIGRGVLSDLYQGEAIMDNRLAAIGSGGGLAATIPTGMRVSAVKVDEVVGVAGFATPGMRVDVLISGIPPGGSLGNEGTQVRTVLQNIEVKSAGTDYQKDADGKAKPVQVVNLLVTPEQAEILNLASNQMHIQLVLRNPLDTTIAKIPGTALGNLFGDNKPAEKPLIVRRVQAPQKSAPKAFSIEVINGTERSEQKFSRPEEKQ
jgi:pilus assembly protein CpaB